MTRDEILTAINDMIEGKGDLVGVLEWLPETSYTSFRDLALGYMIGGMKSLATSLISLGERRSLTDRDKIEIDTMIRERIPEIKERIERELHK